ncbi:MAG: hypothetical protein WBC44_14980 [Planctomycetaceae bacterium]
MMTVLVICAFWVLGCVALAYVILRAGAACDDGPRPIPRSTDSESDAVNPPADAVLPEEDACHSA